MILDDEIKLSPPTDDYQIKTPFVPSEPPTYDFTQSGDLLNDLLCLDLLKDTVSPMDSAELVQVLANP
jgi:hypothetical protein